MPRSSIDSENRPAVFAGIDYHKRFSVVSLGDSNGALLEQVKLSNDECLVRKFFTDRAPLECAIENCRGNEWFVEILRESGCSVKVSNTYAVRLIADSKCKTDKIDSRILLDLLAKDYLPTCYQPTREERAIREKIRWRTKLMRSRTQYKNCAHALLDNKNKGHSLSSARLRKKVVQGIDGSELSDDRKKRLVTMTETIDYFDQLIRDEDKEIAQLANSNPDALRLMTIPGIGNLSALLLISELGDITRFKRARQVPKYFGLVPSIYSSSDKSRLGSITKTGSKQVRRMLVQDAWVAVRHCPVIRHKYNKILKRRGKKIAIVAIARMLSEVAFHILRDKTEFDPSKLTLG